MRKRKILKRISIVEKVALVVMLIAGSAMDSSNLVVPAVVLIASMVCFLFCYKVEERCGFHG
jgi:Ca2+/H+ antiporter